MTFTVETDDKGNRRYQIGVSHAAPRPASFFAIYALPPHLPVATLPLGGIGSSMAPPPIEGAFPVFVASDSEGWFGHQCPRCRGYWRARQLPTACAYCGARGAAHTFVTEAQRRYVAAYLARLQDALSDPADGKHVINMDEVASAVGKVGEKPAFYYSEQRQQTHLKCETCGGTSDIIGRFGYCSGCGTRNDLAEFEADIERLRQRINEAASHNDCVRDGVALFDASAGQYMRQLVRRTPLTPARRDRLKRMRFHDLSSAVDEFKTVFGIDLCDGIAPDDVAFATLMFHRRHVYEHGGGEVDEKYLRDSGDTTVRLKQMIRETQESAHRLAGMLVRMQRNLHAGFHSIFPPDRERIAMEAAHKRHLASISS